ncbi:TetR/AcrR family transcriptional regulator [Saccharibacillus qingshengii]|uniref:TetR/AcrR family transcriptional regulator n=1 Tax=Saccharibacillus qingshengii TaxID=1763540 RepID=UPI001554E0F4|nr:TetR/AcrR family transcriptional regulator C-terminal domain-containing protein [Saccharibacillus qingshengii]
MKKQQPQISEDKILEASWELLREGDIEKFSMRKLADRLGIQAPSLYWHFKSKQDLYQRMANRISKTIVEEFESEGSWREQITTLALTMRSVLGRYPCAVQLTMMTLPHEPDTIRFTNLMLLCVEETPLTQEEKFQVMLSLANYVYYFVLDNDQHQRNVAVVLEEKQQDPQGQINGLLDTMSESEAGLFRRLYRSGMFEVMGSDESFEFGLKVIVLGIEQVIAERQGNEA